MSSLVSGRASRFWAVELLGLWGSYVLEVLCREVSIERFQQVRVTKFVSSRPVTLVRSLVSGLQPLQIGRPDNGEVRSGREAGGDLTSGLGQ